MIWRVLVFFLLFPGALYGFWPVAWDFDGEKRFLGPLASYREEEGNTGFTFRPFLFSYDSRNDGEYHFLYPLGKSTREKSFFVPLYYGKSTGEEEWDKTFFLFYWGKSEKQGAYGGFFPFYGTMYDRFGADELGFFMWPLYSYKKSEGAEKYNFLFPFVASYGGSEKGFKVWPLYGTRERMGEKKSTFFLWPLLIRQEKDLDTDDPTEVVMVTPFYMGATSGTRRSYSILWPVYSYHKDPYKEKKGFFLGLFSRTEGTEAKGFSFMPFVAYERREEEDTFTEKREPDTTLTLLWPLYRDVQYYVEGEKYVNRRIFLLNRYLKEKGRTFLSVWPFFEHRREGDETFVYIPTIMPFRDSVYDRIVRPLLTLYEQKSGPGRSSVNVLYGLFTDERNGDDWKTRVAFLLEAKKEQGRFGFEVLCGLFGIDKNRVKILFIPFSRG